MNWKKIVAWIAGTLLLLLAVVGIGGYVFLQSQSFHRYVLAKIMQVASDSTGGKVYVRSFDFHWSGLRADLYDIVIHGTESADQRPLLRVDKLTVGLKVLSVLHHQVNLNELLIEHPVANLIVDKDGRNNVPQPNAPKQQSSQTNVFDLAVGHVLLSGGELYYNDKKSLINADVRDFRTETDFSSPEKRYSGSISYHQGSVQYANLKSLPHGLDLQFSATPAQLSLSSIVLTVGSSRISLQAKISDYANPRLGGNYNALVHTQDIAGLMGGASPAGDVTLAGTIQYQSLPNQSLLRALALNGTVNSNGLKIDSVQGNVYVNKIQGRFRLADGNFTAPDVIAELLNGRVSAKVNVAHLDANPATNLHATLLGISIDAIKHGVRNPSVKQLPLTGTVQGGLDASWSDSMKDLQLRSDVNVHGGIFEASAGSSNSTPRSRTVPLDGAIHVSYDTARNLISVRRSTLSTPASTVFAEGQVSDHSNLRLEAKSSDLRELNSLSSAFSSVPKQAGNPQNKPLNIAGSANLNGTVTGSLQQPHLDAQVSASDLQVGESKWSTLRVSAQAGPSGISVRDGVLISARSGQIKFDGNVGLRNWSYSDSSPLAANVSIRRISVDEIQQIAGMKYPASGDLSGDVVLRGSQIDPVGHGSVQISDAVVYGEPMQNLDVQFDAANGSVNSSFKISMPAGSSAGTLMFVPKTNAYKVRMDAPAIVLTKLHAVQAKNMQLNGTLTASASGAGTLDDPQLTASIQLPKLQLRQTAITGIKAQLNVTNHRAAFDLRSDVAEASVQAKGTVDLRGDYYADAKIDTSRIPLDPLLVMVVPSRPNGFQGQTELHATIKGPLKDRTRMEAHLEIPTLAASYQ
ncbi:MAG: translocation and assembly module TamB, partial [Acidobacteriaceae bacterium]